MDIQFSLKNSNPIFAYRSKGRGCRIYWPEDGINFIIRLGVLYWNRGRKKERERARDREIYFMIIRCGRMSTLDTAHENPYKNDKTVPQVRNQDTKTHEGVEAGLKTVSISELQMKTCDELDA
jgi:hypothetical protein